MKATTIVRQIKAATQQTDAELAYRMGVSEKTVRRWRKGESVPRVPHMRKLFALLGEAGSR